MMLKLIASTGDEPVFRRAYDGENDYVVWVELPEHLKPRTDKWNVLWVRLDGQEYPIDDVLTSVDGQPALNVPDPLPDGQSIRLLRVVTPQELPRRTGESKIAKLRIASGLTQRELGERIGATAAQIGNWECGARVPKLSSLKRIATALGCSYTDLIED